MTIHPTFSQLVDITRVQQLLEAQYKVMGTSLAILDESENILVAVGWQEVCTQFHRVHPDCCVRCRESDAYIKAHLHSFSGEYLDYKCKNGLWDVAVPIRINETHMATFFIGQFFYDDEKPDQFFFRTQARRFGFDENGYLRAVDKVPIFSREQVRNIMKYCRNLVQVMAELGLKNLELTQEVAERKKAEQEASFFKTLIEYTRDPVYALNPDEGYRIIYANQAACSHFGKTREQVLSMCIPDFDTVFDMRNADRNQEQLKQGHSMRFETVHRVASGQQVPVEVTANYMEHNGQGLAAGYFHDITERKKAEEQILRLNRLYAVLSETNKAIVHSSGRQTLFEAICRVVTEYGGFQLAWIGLVDERTATVIPVAWSKNGDDFLVNIRVSAREEPEGMGAVGSAIRDGSLKIINDYLHDPCTSPWRREAEEHGYESVAAVALKVHGKVMGALTIYAGEKQFFHEEMAGLLSQLAADVSFALDNLDREARRRNVERALQEETQQRLRTAEELCEKERLLVLQSRQAALGEMIENIAHQWRQPLNTLGLILQELSCSYYDGGLSGEFLDDAVDKAMELILHMSQTMDDFRNFYRPDKERVTFAVQRVIKKALSLVAGNFKSFNISVETHVTDDPVVSGYPNEYAQVLLNILLNARDAFSERKIVCPRIRISLAAENGKSIVTIADNAGGVPDDIIDRIFEPYVTTKGDDRGTGVGLFMSKTIVEKNMNGSLTVRNTAEGAEFRIEV